jgi:serine/threonine protein phosphatase PrpC
MNSRDARPAGPEPPLGGDSGPWSEPTPSSRTSGVGSESLPTVGRSSGSPTSDGLRRQPAGGDPPDEVFDQEALDLREAPRDHTAFVDSTEPPSEQPPATDPGRATWAHDEPGLLTVTIWTERVKDRGEDAEPLFAHHVDRAQGVLAVFDGAGGAGSSPAWRGPDGTMRTSAWAGSRTSRLAAECWFHEVAEGIEEAVPETLKNYLRHFLSSAPQRRSKISGTMRRQLPSTLAALHYEAVGRTLTVHALWAGDSRGYVLRPGTGLQVLTQDHVGGGDALELLRIDPPMTNMVCADRPFHIDSSCHEALLMPCVLVAATDGFFGYVHTPADFELLLLQTLRAAQSAEGWAQGLCAGVCDYTGDDATLAVAALGYRDFAGLRQAFVTRHQQLEESIGGWGAPRGQGDPDHIRTWQDATWKSYRANYEALLPRRLEEDRA